jgi:hypothetical protein
MEAQEIFETFTNLVHSKKNYQLALEAGCRKWGEKFTLAGFDLAKKELMVAHGGKRTAAHQWAVARIKNMWPDYKLYAEQLKIDRQLFDDETSRMNSVPAETEVDLTKQMETTLREYTEPAPVQKRALEPEMPETSLVTLRIGHMTLVAEKGPGGYRADKCVLERATHSSYEGENVQFRGKFEEEPWPYLNWPLDVLPENLRLARAYPSILRDYPDHTAIQIRYVHILAETVFDSPVPGSHMEAEVWSVDPDSGVVSSCVYELNSLKIPVLNDAFSLGHAETDIKREVNQVFAGAVDPRTVTLVLDCPHMGTTEHLLALANPSAVYVVNPQARGDCTPEGFYHDHPNVVMVPHVFHQALMYYDLPQGNLALDYCCTFFGDANKCMPFEDVRSALRMRQLEPDGGVLWVTYSLRGVRTEDMRDPISLISQWGEECGYELVPFYEKTYGKIGAVMFKSCCEREVVDVVVEVSEMRKIPRAELEAENTRLRSENKKLRSALEHLVKL